MVNPQPQPINARDLQYWLADDRPSPLLVDVREASELAIAPFPQTSCIFPSSASSAWLRRCRAFKVDQPVVVLCHAGVRSHHFGLWLLEQRWELEVWNLEGGIDAWSVQVDPSVPRY